MQTRINTHTYTPFYMCMYLLNLYNTFYHVLWGRNYYYPQFTNKEMETRKDWVTWPRLFNLDGTIWKEYSWSLHSRVGRFGPQGGEMWFSQQQSWDQITGLLDSFSFALSHPAASVGWEFNSRGGETRPVGRIRPSTLFYPAPCFYPKAAVNSLPLFKE